jgi:hypothetical protein
MRQVLEQYPFLFTTMARVYVSHQQTRDMSRGIHRGAMGKCAAMVLLYAGSAVLGNAPARVRNSQHTPIAVNVAPTALSGFTQSKPRQIGQEATHARIHHSETHRVFQPPPQPSLQLASTEKFEIESDLEIPDDLTVEQSPSLVVEQLKLPPPPPFQSNRRVLGTVRRGFEEPTVNRRLIARRWVWACCGTEWRNGQGARFPK